MLLCSYRPCDREIKESRIFAVIESVAKLGDVLMKMAKCNAVVLAGDATLQQSPERFDGIGMNLPVYIGDLMVNHGMAHEAANLDVAAVLIRDEDGIGYVDVVAHKLGKALGIQLGLIDRTGNDVPATFQNPDHGSLRSTTSALVRSATFTGLPTDVALVHLHDAPEKFALLKHGVSDSHAHKPSRVFVDLEIAGKLAGGDALLGIQHKGDRQEPDLQVKMGVVEDGVYGNAERGIAGIAVVSGLFRHRRGAGRFAVRASRFAMPTDAFNMSDTISFGGPFLVNRADVHGYPLLRQQQGTPEFSTCQEKSSTLN